MTNTELKNKINGTLRKYKVYKTFYRSMSQPYQVAKPRWLKEDVYIVFFEYHFQVVDRNISFDWKNENHILFKSPLLTNNDQYYDEFIVFKELIMSRFID